MYYKNGKAITNLKKIYIKNYMCCYFDDIIKF